MGFVWFPPFAVVVVLLYFLLLLRRLVNDAAAAAAGFERWPIRLMSVTSLLELSLCDGLIPRDYPIKYCSRMSFFWFTVCGLLTGLDERMGCG